MRRHQVEDRLIRFPFIGPGAENAPWLVQEEVNRRRGTGRWLPGDAHVVARPARSWRDRG